MLLPETPADSPVYNLPDIENATTLLADDSVVLPPQVIPGLLYKGLKAVLGSSSKARKTWILLDIGLSVASGTNFWKWPTEKGKVIYINFEILRPFFRNRIREICEKKKIEDTSNFDIWTLRGKAASLGTLLPEVIKRIKEENYSLVIIDPIYKGLGGRDENSAGDIGELCNELERLAVETGAAVLYAAHFSKGNQAGKEAIDRISGSGVWARDADVIITLTKHREEQQKAFTVDLILRNSPEVESFVVAWEVPLMVVRDDLDPDDLKQPRGRARTHEPADILEVFGDGPTTISEWQQRAEQNGVSQSSFYRLLKSVKHSGQIVLRDNKKWERQPGRVSFAKTPPPALSMQPPASPATSQSQTSSPPGNNGAPTLENRSSTKDSSILHVLSQS